ncbi:uncharacterized protein LOC113460345 [Zonotrichia albicollis]|uniref:uncharacterized protein LOC113460345 n=1 Tax=Zonotrichia albicollis TaxID=44394 RepID=UPI003D8114F0
MVLFFLSQTRNSTYANLSPKWFKIMCDSPKEEAAKKKDNGPAADQNKVSLCSIRVQSYKGKYKAEGAEKKEDKFSLCNPETDPKGQRKVRASEWLPAATSTRPCLRSDAVERGKGILPGAVEGEKEDSDSSWGSKHLTNFRDKAINPVQRPAGKHSRVGMHSLLEKHGKGVLQPAGAAVKKEDTDSPGDPETDPKGQRKVWASEWLPAATSTRPCLRSDAVERGKGILPGAESVEGEKEDSDSSWGSKPFSAIVEKVFAGGRRPAADHRGGGVRSAPAESSKGVLQAAGRSRKNDNSWDSETESEDEGKASAAVQLPAANSNRLDAPSAAVEHGKEVLKQTWREVKKEERVLQPAAEEAKQEYSDSPWDSEPFSAIVEKVFAGGRRPAADHRGGGVRSAPAESSKGVLQAAGRSRKNDNSWDSETESEDEGKASAAVQLPAANSNRLDAPSAAVEHGKEVLKQTWREVKKEERVLQPAAEEAKQEYSDSPWDSEVPYSGGPSGLACFRAHFPLLLLLSHVSNLDLDVLLLQTSCSDGTGTK